MAKKKKPPKNLNTALYDDGVVRAVQLLKFREDLIRRTKAKFVVHDGKFLEQVERLLFRLSVPDMQRLSTGVSLARGTERTKALAEALKELVLSSRGLAREATAELKELAFDEAQFWAGRMNHHLPDALGVSVDEVSKTKTNKAWSQFLIAGETVNQSVDRWGRQRAEILNSVIRRQAFEGLEASAMVKGLGGKGGFLARNVDGSPNGLGLRLRTATTASISAGQKAFAAENDLVNDLIWTAIIDSRTSRICTARHGKLVNKELGGALPPAHPQCRSYTTPGVYNIRRARELKKRLPEDALDIEGRIPDHETAEAWLLRQTEDMQRQVLGPARFDLWNTGKFKWPDDFVRATNGKVWTLAELKKRNAAFFKNRQPAKT